MVNSSLAWVAYRGEHKILDCRDSAQRPGLRLSLALKHIPAPARHALASRHRPQPLPMKDGETGEVGNAKPGG